MYIRASDGETSNPSEKDATLLASTAVWGVSVSGMPMSEADSTWSESAANAWPTCMAKAAAPSCCTMPIIGCSICMKSGGMPSGIMSRSCAGSAALSSSLDICDKSVPSGVRPATAPVTCSAIGVTIRFHAGPVVTSQSERDHACVGLPAAGKVVTSSSHNSAKATAEEIASRCPSEMDGSPADVTALRATSSTTVQLTGPSAPGAPADCIIWPSCCRA